MNRFYNFARTALLSFTISVHALASIQVMFHPTDPTLKEIASYIKSARQTVDIAIYNIDSTTNNPIIETIASKEIQGRLRSGDLTIRMIYEGFLGPEADNKKCLTLEAYGIDVRRFAPGQTDQAKVHHKFAVFDGRSKNPTLVTGSANWSTMSRDGYDENILFLQDEPDLAYDFQSQFELLWKTSEEFGQALSQAPTQSVPRSLDWEELSVRFNSANFKFSQLKIKKKPDTHVLTDTIVGAIDSAEHSLQIATTRISLKDIYLALKRAAKRGIKIDLVVNMDQYHQDRRRSWNLPYLLGLDNFDGHENITVRLKFFHLGFDKKMGQFGFPTYLSHQMHSKYLITDNRWVYTGSFNWSPSSEFKHIENVVRIDGDYYPHVLSAFQKNFAYLNTMGRKRLPKLSESLTQALEAKQNPPCWFKPIVMTYQEIDTLLSLGKPYNIELKDYCDLNATPKKL